ncbi:MAG: DUF1592 domain-containing protein [Myxococcota bacterium]
MERSLRLLAIAGALTGCQGVFGPGPESGFEQDPLDDDPLPETLPTGDVFACEDPAGQTPSPSFLLTKEQLANTLEDFFGRPALRAIEVGLSRHGAETYDEATHARTSTLETTKVNAYHDIARATARHVASDDQLTETVFGTCALEATLAAGCIDGFIDGFAVRILRRPLTTSEHDFITMLAARDAPARQNLEASLAYLLQSPFFTWRLELGEDALPSDRFALTPYEVASRIAFDVTDAAPDAQLLAAAERGELGTQPEVEAHVRRLLETPRGRAKVVNNLAHWSISNTTADLSSLPEALTEGIEMDGLGEAMLEETRRYIDATIFEQGGSFEDLLTSTDSFATHPGLATIYEHDPAGEDAPATMGNGRHGLLMRSPALTWTGVRTSIIHRGVDFQTRILCNQIPSPNVDIVEAREENALTDEEAAVASNREVVAHLTSPDRCMLCHSIINPTGFALEAFDPLGRLRTEELLVDDEGNQMGAVMINTAATVPLPDGSELPVTGPAELVDYVATSSAGRACFARSIHRFVAERVESPRDECRVQAVHETLMNSDTLVNALAALIAHESIFNKVVATE